ncbi:MAG: hypothetical protein QOG91_370 [Candidatus Parcubacteria bacterium]|nr:hypothetical protein [Candidatus Parcubacteria bacterium]
MHGDRAGSKILVLVFVAITALLAAIFIITHQRSYFSGLIEKNVEKKRERQVRLGAMAHAISEKGLHAEKPVDLGANMFYFGDSAIGASRSLASFLNERPDLGLDLAVFAAASQNYGSAAEGLFAELSRMLVISNGYFAVFRTKNVPELVR